MDLFWTWFCERRKIKDKLGLIIRWTVSMEFYFTFLNVSSVRKYIMVYSSYKNINSNIIQEALRKEPIYFWLRLKGSFINLRKTWIGIVIVDMISKGMTYKPLNFLPDLSLKTVCGSSPCKNTTQRIIKHNMFGTWIINKIYFVHK